MAWNTKTIKCHHDFFLPDSLTCTVCVPADIGSCMCSSVSSFQRLLAPIASFSAQHIWVRTSNTCHAELWWTSNCTSSACCCLYDEATVPCSDQAARETRDCWPASSHSINWLKMKSQRSSFALFCHHGNIRSAGAQTLTSSLTAVQ